LGKKDVYPGRWKFLDFTLRNFGAKVPFKNEAEKGVFAG